MAVTTLVKVLKTISSEVGILQHVVSSTRLNGDPKLQGWGILPSDTRYLNAESFGGQSAGCATEWEDAMLGTIGETVERYAPTFHNADEEIFTSYKQLKEEGIHPKEFALFHPNQYKTFEERGMPVVPFNEDTEVRWFPTYDLTDGHEKWIPGQFIYMPFRKDPKFITMNTSTGLAAHTNFHKAILTGLMEVVERDSFVITWAQKIVPPKIVINEDIQQYIDENFPTQYEWHFFNMTYDLGVPSVFGICFGETEFGKFVAIGGSTRTTFGEAVKKTIQEVGQAIPFFRYSLESRKDWNPDDDFTKLFDFDDHSLLYVKRPELWNEFDRWTEAPESFEIDFKEAPPTDDIETIRQITKTLKKKGYNVLVKDLTTPDLRQIGFYSVKIFVPQLIQLAGAYLLYYHGGKRLYEVPQAMGYTSNDFDNLNPFPHPFP
ncbi:YcaO-like family protein [Prolixibacteraceae bacterium]|nr:YcaO-like family protein [Prolixibacteraceae bacterium]